MKNGNLVQGFDFRHGRHKPLAVSKSAGQTNYPEDAEQEALFEWIRANSQRCPDLAALRHIPNGGFRGENRTVTRKDGSSYTYNPVGAALKRRGVLRGTFDNLLPIGRRGYHSFWFELKVNRGELERAPKEYWDQVRERDRLIAHNNSTHVFWNWVEAAWGLIWYLDCAGAVLLPSRHNPIPQLGHDERCGCDYLRVKPMIKTSGQAAA